MHKLWDNFFVEWASMKLLRQLLIVFAIGFSTPSKALTTLGSPGCGEWVKEHTDKNQIATLAQEFWLTGYLTGIAAGSGKDILKSKISPDSIYLWMDNYCRSNPLETVHEGGRNLAQELMKRIKK